jgi:hypothetical protein
VLLFAHSVWKEHPLIIVVPLVAAVQRILPRRPCKKMGGKRGKNDTEGIENVGKKNFGAKKK